MESAWCKPIILGLQETNPDNKKTCQMINHFVLRAGVLFHRIVKFGYNYYRLCMPKMTQCVINYACSCIDC